MGWMQLEYKVAVFFKLSLFIFSHSLMIFQVGDRVPVPNATIMLKNFEKLSKNEEK